VIANSQPENKPTKMAKQTKQNETRKQTKLTKNKTILIFGY
jgi:hypothetical protein